MTTVKDVGREEAKGGKSLSWACLSTSPTQKEKELTDVRKSMKPAWICIASASNKYLQ